MQSSVSVVTVNGAAVFEKENHRCREFVTFLNLNHLIANQIRQ